MDLLLEVNNYAATAHLVSSFLLLAVHPIWELFQLVLIASSGECKCKLQFVRWFDICRMVAGVNVTAGRHEHLVTNSSNWLGRNLSGPHLWLQSN